MNCIYILFFLIYIVGGLVEHDASVHGSTVQVGTVTHLMNDKRSIVQRNQRFGTTKSSMYLHLLAILLSNDVALNPGPTTDSSTCSSYQCGTCDKPVNWSHRGIVCDTCNQWFHVSCQSMTSSVYNLHANDSAAAWDCIMCGCPNFSTFCFTQVFSTSNNFSILEDLPPESPVETFRMKPVHTSTPERHQDRGTRDKTKPLRIINVNFQSIKTKQAEFANLIESSQPDIIFGTETWIDNTIKDNQFITSGFSLYRKDRNLNGGGVFVAVKDNLSTVASPEFETDCEIVWCKLEILGRKTLYLASYYNPKTSNHDGLVHFRESLERASMVTNAALLIAGDFNLPGVDWENKCVKAGSQHTATHEYFIDTVDDFGLTQVVKTPTRGMNLLDLVLTNRPSSITRTEVLPGLSDHDIVFVEMDAKPVRYKQKPREIPIYSKANWSAIKDDLKQTETLLMNMKRSCKESVNSMWDTFQKCLESSIKKNIPTKTAKTKDQCPWVTYDIRKLIKKRDRWYKRMKKSGNAKDKEKLRNLKKTTQRELRRSYWNYIDGIVSPSPEIGKEGQSNKKFWTFIKHKKSDGNNIPPLKQNGLLHSNPIDKASILNKQFQTAFSEKVTFENEEFAKDYKMDGSYSDISDIVVTEKGVLKLLLNLNISKAPGPDNISPRVLKELAVECAPILTLIFNASYQTGEIPNIWKSANICPIFKKGKRFDPINYRPVSLTCISCKLMEHIVTSHIMTHADKNNILYPLQHGFRRGLSCETQLLEFIDDVSKNLENGKQTDCLIMDFSKAFDKVSHSLLIHKLKHYGVTGKTSTWIENFLSDRSQSVVVEGERSDSAPVASGVPQGSVLGPSLFLFYINDMPQGLVSQVRLFADDTIAYIAVSNSSDCSKLQEDLDKLSIWESKWLMNFHPDKCQVLTISNNRKLYKENYKLRNHTLEHVSSAKYLGITITSDLRWNQHVSNICGKANSTIGFLKRNLNISNKIIKEKAYKSLVRPSVEYACSVWDPYFATDIRKLEMIQRRGARYVLNRYHNRSSVTEMLDHLDWQPLQDRRKTARLTMMYKLTYGLVNIQCNDKLKLNQRRSRNNNNMSYQIPSCRTTARKESFYPRTIRDWNTLPADTVSAPSLKAFKAQLSN